MKLAASNRILLEIGCVEQGQGIVFRRVRANLDTKMVPRLPPRASGTLPGATFL